MTAKTACSVWRARLRRATSHVWARRPVPFAHQSTIYDCGPSCLRMVLGYHGMCRASVDAAPARRHTALELVEVAVRSGLLARGVGFCPIDVELLPIGTILHLRADHFVVLVGRSRRRVTIFDPFSGSRVIERATAAALLSGVAVLAEPPQCTPSAAVRGYLGALLRGSLSRCVVELRQVRRAASTAVAPRT
jgi:ABC-type bacteriocin/lantibiotic exporter with double-glycine peptidase domain